MRPRAARVDPLGPPRDRPSARSSRTPSAGRPSAGSLGRTSRRYTRIRRHTHDPPREGTDWLVLPVLPAVDRAERDIELACQLFLGQAASSADRLQQRAEVDLGPHGHLPSATPHRGSVPIRDYIRLIKFPSGSRMATPGGPAWLLSLGRSAMSALASRPPFALIAKRRGAAKETHATGGQEHRTLSEVAARLGPKEPPRVPLARGRRHLPSAPVRDDASTDARQPSGACLQGVREALSDAGRADPRPHPRCPLRSPTARPLLARGRYRDNGSRGSRALPRGRARLAR